MVKGIKDGKFIKRNKNGNGIKGTKMEMVKGTKNGNGKGNHGWRLYKGIHGWKW